MVHFTAIIKRFGEQGEKTGWTYIEIPAEIAGSLKPGTKTSFRVKGRLDSFGLKQQALLPIGDGKFILPLKTAVRKDIKKDKGAEVDVWLQADDAPLLVNPVFLECLHDEPEALRTFEGLAKGHQQYFSKWIDSAKTEATITKRIAMAVEALAKGGGFTEMLRANKKGD